MMQTKKKTRAPLQLLVPFMEVARELARLREKPVSWMLMQLIAEAADAEGIKRPLLPWEGKP